MKHIILITLALFVTGCATNSDIRNLQSQIDGINIQIKNNTTEQQYKNHETDSKFEILTNELSKFQSEQAVHKRCITDLQNKVFKDSMMK